MSDRVEIIHNGRKVLSRFRRLPADVQAGVRRGLVRGLLLVEDVVKRRADVKFSGARSGLASRLTSYVEGGRPGMGIDGVIGFRRRKGFPYELSQEFGAKARPGGAMAVPVSREARALSEAGTSARDFPRKLFVVPRKGMLAESGGRGRKLLVHYVFVKSLEPRLHFRESVTDNLDVVLREVLREAKGAV